MNLKIAVLFPRTPQRVLGRIAGITVGDLNFVTLEQFLLDNNDAPELVQHVAALDVDDTLVWHTSDGRTHTALRLPD